MAEKLCELKKKGGSGGSSNDFVFFFNTKTMTSGGLAGYHSVGATDNGKLTIKTDVYSYTGYTFNTSDFSGTLTSGSGSITIKKAGNYEINNNGTITNQNFVANSVVSVPNALYTLRKL